jgi:hypothetical protein
MAPQEIAANLRVIKAEASTPGVKKSFALFNNHGRANSAANAIMLSQELGVRLKAMPGEAMVLKFPDLVQGKRRSFHPALSSHSRSSFSSPRA